MSAHEVDFSEVSSSKSVAKFLRVHYLSLAQRRYPTLEEIQTEIGCCRTTARKYLQDLEFHFRYMNNLAAFLRQTSQVQEEIQTSTLL